MLIWINIVFSSFTETPIDKYNQSLINISKSVLNHAQEHESTYILRDNDGSGSLITFKDENESQEWAASFQFQVPTLKFSEKAYITFWYTNNGFIDGDYYGHDGTFEGIMFGLELTHNMAEIILSLNDGRDYVNYEDLAMREFFKLENLKGNITFKLVYTKKNMKLEVYNNNKLVYDALRFYDTTVLHFIGGHKVFSVTSRYNNVGIDKHFTLLDFKVYDRIESENYDARSMEVTGLHHSDHELEHTIANLEFFLGYLKYVIGTPTGSTIIKGLILLNEEISKEKEKIEQLMTIFDPKHIKLSEISQKIIAMDIQMQNTVRVMNELKYFLLDFEKVQEKNSHWVFLVVFISIGCIVIYSLLPEKKIKEN